jgi:hypothetical protein
VIFTPEELKDLDTLISVGAKTISADKPLRESAMIQNLAISLLQKIHSPPSDEPKAE